MSDAVQTFLSSISALISACDNSDIIAYGTGKVGKLLIPYLAQNPKVRLIGVTNKKALP